MEKLQKRNNKSEIDSENTSQNNWGHTVPEDPVHGVLSDDEAIQNYISKQIEVDKKSQPEKQPNESIQEKISLSDRFGLSIFYPKPHQAEYFEIVLYLAEKAGIDTDRDILIAEARKWAVLHGGYSGRCATQFIAQFKISNLN